MIFQVKTGSEWHSTERRGATVFVKGKPIYEVLKPLKSDWEAVGQKGRHGKWCTAEYEIPIGTKVRFEATANGREKITQSFKVHEELDVDYSGYSYGDRICGWIISL